MRDRRPITRRIRYMPRPSQPTAKPSGLQGSDALRLSSSYAPAHPTTWAHYEGAPQATDIADVHGVPVLAVIAPRVRQVVAILIGDRRATAEQYRLAAEHASRAVSGYLCDAQGV